MSKIEQRVLHVYLGNLTAVGQTRFLAVYEKAKKHGVEIDQFVEAWNCYAKSIDDHVFITDTPGDGA